MKIPLSPRLSMLAQWVPLGAHVIDVGTDHAYLPAWLLRENRIGRALVSDLRPGPLSRARNTARRYHLTERMEFLLCDGLAGIGPEQADTVILAGMGGETIARILQEAPWTALGNHRLILQPMSAQPALRQFLYRNRYAILDEALAQEQGSIYNALLVSGGQMESPSAGELYVGSALQGYDSPLVGTYLDHWIARLKRESEGLAQSSKPEDVSRRAVAEAALRDLIHRKGDWLQCRR